MSKEFNNPKRVLQIFGSLGVGGAETRMMEVYRNIDRTKIQFDFITMEDKQQYYQEEIESLGGFVYKVISPRENIFKHFFQLKKIMKANGPYIAVHAHTSWHCGLAVFAAKLAKISIRITHARTTGTTHEGVTQKMFSLIGKNLITLFATNKLAISEAAAKYVYGKNTDKVQFVPNAIDLKAFRNFKPMLKEKLRKKYNVPTDKLIIGHIGRFSAMKNQKFLVDLILEINKTTPSCAVLIGDGELRAQVEKYALYKGVNQNMIFCGIQSNIAAWISIFDIVVIPSRYEGLCGVAIESQAMGKECVLSTGIPEKETNLGLGLCQYISLDKPINQWVEQIINITNRKCVSTKEIDLALLNRGYLIENEIATLMGIYIR